MAAFLFETYEQLLLRKVVGRIGREECAAKLGVAVSSLDAWMRGSATMPDRSLVVLAQVVDKVLHPS
jgi:hypothetical protein